jgi:hypothetical protein
MACVGLVVDDQEAVMQLLGALLASYKTFVTIVGNMPTLTLPILMAKLQEIIMNKKKTRIHSIYCILLSKTNQQQIR